MHIKEERNLNYEPEIAKEGVFLKPLPIPPKPKENKWWFEGLKPTERLFYHQTLSSARRYVPFKQNELIPKCAMDNALMSHFDQTKSLFPNKIDICLTNETKGMRTFRRLRNYTETVVFEPEHQRVRKRDKHCRLLPNPSPIPMNCRCAAPIPQEELTQYYCCTGW